MIHDPSSTGFFVSELPKKKRNGKNLLPDNNNKIIDHQHRRYTDRVKAQRKARNTNKRQSKSQSHHKQHHNNTTTDELRSLPVPLAVGRRRIML
jgi:hypothetical protein